MNAIVCPVGHTAFSCSLLALCRQGVQVGVVHGAQLFCSRLGSTVRYPRRGPSDPRPVANCAGSAPRGGGGLGAARGAGRAREGAGRHRTCPEKGKDGVPFAIRVVGLVC